MNSEAQSTTKPRINIQQLKEAFNKLSTREKGLIVIATVVGSILAVYYWGIVPVADAFTRQSQRLAELKQTLEVAPDMLQRYAKLQSRRVEIEKFYERVEFKEATLSYIEGLIRRVAQVPSGYNVDERTQPSLADKYAHKAYVIRFETSNLQNLTAFLKALVYGEQPMVLSRITVEKRLATDSLAVQLEANSFEKKAST